MKKIHAGMLCPEHPEPRSFRHKLHPSVFQAFRAGKEGKNDVRIRTRLLAGKDGFMPAGEIDGHTGI